MSDKRLNLYWRMLAVLLLMAMATGCGTPPKKDSAHLNRSQQLGMSALMHIINARAFTIVPGSFELDKAQADLTEQSKHLEGVQSERNADIQAREKAESRVKYLEGEFWSVRQKRWFWSILTGFVLLGTGAAVMSTFASPWSAIGRGILGVLPLAQMFTLPVKLFLRRG